MNKYIDAEKLKAEIERKKAPFEKDIEDNVYPTYLCALMDFEDLIDSLQQEQPEMDLEKEIDNYIGSHFSEAHDCVLLSDSSGMELTTTDIAPMARHFYELGRLNARKEE